MTWTVELTPEVERALEKKAAQRGLALPDYLRELAEQDALRHTGEEPLPASHSVPEWAAGLRTAADSGDEIGFIVALREAPRDALTAQDWELAIRLALQAGAHVQARELAQEGARRFPNDQRLQKRAHILSPPRVVGAFSVESENAAAQKADHEWMRTHWGEHRGQWIALRNGQLLGTASTLRELREQLRRAGIDLTIKPFMTKIH